MANGVFQAMNEAIASGDPRRISDAREDAITALGCVCSMLNVMADYAYLRAQHPSESLYADDNDLAQTAYSISDLTACARAALIEADCLPPNPISDERIDKNVVED